MHGLDTWDILLERSEGKVRAVSWVHLRRFMDWHHGCMGPRSGSRSCRVAKEVSAVSILRFSRNGAYRAESSRHFRNTQREF
jgi:hypothetical protein